MNEAKSVVNTIFSDMSAACAVGGRQFLLRGCFNTGEPPGTDINAFIRKKVGADALAPAGLYWEGSIFLNVPGLCPIHF
ncbi:hypothetical protein Brsp02_03486 [Brucella sp. NBRC 113783]